MYKKILKFVHIKNENFKNLRISSLCKLRSYKDYSLIRNICICVYIVLILKLNINFFLCIYIRNTFSSRRSEEIAFNKIKCFYYYFLK